MNINQAQDFFILCAHNLSRAFSLNFQRKSSRFSSSFLWTSLISILLCDTFLDFNIALNNSMHYYAQIFLHSSGLNAKKWNDSILKLCLKFRCHHLDITGFFLLQSRIFSSPNLVLWTPQKCRESFIFCHSLHCLTVIRIDRKSKYKCSLLEVMQQFICNSIAIIKSNADLNFDWKEGRRWIHLNIIK